MKTDLLTTTALEDGPIKFVSENERDEKLIGKTKLGMC